ncbi:MAG: FG-GAP-like repeat-containing protein [Bacteroidia bacterium]|nr:FG-GAP-like repeat-containing protein [Bacteroidia bacterium]
MSSKGADSLHAVYENILGPVQHFRSGRTNWAVVVVDMDRDGNPDVVSASRSDGLLSVHYNDGKGDFKKKRSKNFQDSHRAMVSLDANGDDWPDVATITERGKLCVIYNDGKGFFKNSQVLLSGLVGQDIVGIDIDADEDIDLLTVAHREQVVSIHTNNGKGRFSAPIKIKTGEGPRCLAVGDIDNDGLQDLVVGGDKGYLYIHKGTGIKQFSAPSNLRSCRDIWGVGLADFNKDGHMDIAACSYLNQDLFIHPNEGGGEFLTRQELESGAHNINLVIVDIDRDDDLDIVTTSSVDNGLNFHINNGKGLFSDRMSRSTGRRPVSIGEGDFDGDGDVDLVTGSIDDASINVHQNMLMENSLVTRKMKLMVKGKVYDKDNGIILPHVSVSLRSSADKGLDAVFTDENGYFEFELKPNKKYFLLARTKGFPPGRVGFDMPEEQFYQDIYLEVPKETNVNVKVVDRKTGEAIGGAGLSLLDQDENLLKNNTADVNGEFQYKQISLGYNYEILTEADGYDAHSAYFDVEKDDIGKGVSVVVRMSKEPLGRCITGVVTDRHTGEIIPKAGLIFKDSTGRTRAKVRATVDGMYRKCLPYGEYELTTLAKGYFYEVSGFDLSETGTRDDLEYDVSLKPLKKDSAILLNVYFDKAKYNLKKEYFPELRRAIRIMEQNPKLVMEIAGHTSSEGGFEYNRRLSQNRADAVSQYLIENGIEAERIISKGYGEGQLVIEPDDTPEKREKNRRTEFKVVRTDN